MELNILFNQNEVDYNNNIDPIIKKIYNYNHFIISIPHIKSDYEKRYQYSRLECRP